ncbi:energy transducer TonB [uncultured Oxalicibacterium sp.]|uniref:energy transducer TonB n=1 Tax=uncultured Oxalicibacterium sp. TaxID=1168540 RepID=UPI0025D0AE87|nr:energy transducer TonB [uncultured Oxalicibacterium sp.]
MASLVLPVAPVGEKSSIDTDRFAVSGVRSIKSSTWLCAGIVLLLHALLLSSLWFDGKPAAARLAAPVVEVMLAPPAANSEASSSRAEAESSDSSVSAKIGQDAPHDDVVLNATPPDFFSARELDERPYPQQPVVVPYPESALGKPHGSVVLLLHVDARGRVQQVSIVQSDVPSAFEQAAVNAFSEAVMVPGSRHGQAVGAAMKIAVDFGQP